MTFLTKYSLKKHYHYKKEEIKGIIISSILIGFIISYITEGLKEYIILEELLTKTIIIGAYVFLLLTIATLTQKYIGLFIGYETEYRASYFGLLLGFIISGLTYGIIPFFLPGRTIMNEIREKHYGQTKTFYRFYHTFTLNVIPAIVFLTISNITALIFLTSNNNLLIINELIRTGYLMAIFSFIPLPEIGFQEYVGLSGLKIWHFFKGTTYGYDMLVYNPRLYLLFLLLTIVSAILLFFLNKISLTLSIIITITLMIFIKIILILFGK